MPIKIAWIVDPHFDFVPVDQISKISATISQEDVDFVLISGDLGNSTNLSKVLKKLDFCLNVPVFFVLGNHDYYAGSFDDVNATVKKVVEKSKNLNWLRGIDVFSLNDDICIIGHGLWADGVAGSGAKSPVRLNDHCMIRDLRLGQTELYKKLKSLGKAAAEELSIGLEKALKRQFKTILILTHAPPFVEATLYEGKPSEPDWLPHFCCATVGNMILRKMKKFPNSNVKIFSGHTHFFAQKKISSNISIEVGAAEYGDPSVKFKIL